MEVDTSNSTLNLGEGAPYFSLTGTDDKVYSLSSFKDATLLVVVFTCNHCPYAQAYERRLIDLAENFTPQAVQFVAINSNDGVAFPEDDFTQMKARAVKLALPYPYLWDEDQRAAKAYDAKCTPEVYLFDSERLLRYHGRIDDNHRDVQLVKTHNLRDAIEQLLAGQQVTTPLTHVLGCSIKWKDA